jgi:Kef-type K+ transport system membrane component KefB
MELILVNIALEKGFITHGLFTILVLMAIVTTLAASPLFHWIYGREQGNLSAMETVSASETG